ncbi:MAG: hypothetical protein ACKOZU_11500 [Planctomycetaceae bacterium]
MRPVTFSWLAVLLGVACAAIGWLGIAGWIAAVVLAGCVAVHVAGNALGTSLRAATDRDLARTAARRDAAPLPAPPPPARLQRRTSLGGLVVVSAAVGGMIGGVTGAAALLLLVGSTPGGAVLGGGSAAVIGALAGFLLASFVEIVRTSLREAVAAETRAAAGGRA